MKFHTDNSHTEPQTNSHRQIFRDKLNMQTSCPLHKPVEGMCITLLPNLGAICAENDHSVHIWLRQLESQEIPDSEVVAHCKCCPSVVNRCRPIMVDDADPPVAAMVRLKDDLFREVS